MSRASADTIHANDGGIAILAKSLFDLVASAPGVEVTAPTPGMPAIRSSAA